MPRALLSVHDKTGLLPLAQGLVELGWELIASGGTARALTEAGLPVIEIETVTGHPEILGGRVKTLHPAIHAGILARDTDEDRQTLQAHGYTLIDLVVCNLYPFETTVSQQGATLEAAIEQIDIGGVALLRAAAKNFARVTVLSNARDYSHVLNLLKASGAINLETRRRLATSVFEQTSRYDAAIHEFLENAQIPKVLERENLRSEELRYGENPHQTGTYVFDKDNKSGPLRGAVLGGKVLSYNNILDLDAAWRATELFEQPTVVIVKHLTPCGIASGASIAEVFPAALASDPISAFGGVIAVNRLVDDAFVAALGDIFLEAIAAPDFAPSARETLNSKRKNCRLLLIEPEINPPKHEYRSVRGGTLMQSFDHGDPADVEWRVVSKRQPSDEEMKALHFAWKACQFVKSNAIVLAIGEATVGIGGGLPSRVDAAKLAVEKAGEHAKGSVMASDAFFPFPDSVEVGIAAGVTAIVSPGGSIRDEQVLAAADAAGIAMVFTGVRHFRH
ncbi:MAG: bifunctional phosphoribosylaminoimidazolecarboxamide formyltransferase/IMP cyclohydrolase [Chloroflexota bacterium]